MQQITRKIGILTIQFRNFVLSHNWLEHGKVIFLYFILSLLVTWPLVRDFSSKLAGVGDARHHLWTLWQVRQAILGSEPLFHTSLLYYPYGTTLLTSALGPLLGFLALPFWLISPEAAYNGTVLLSITLTGYFMYLLARSLHLDTRISFFSGLILVMAPIHIAAIAGHLSKIFLGLLPLLFLTFRYAIDLKKSAWWTSATALVFFALLLHSGEQFIFAILSVCFFSITAILVESQENRWSLIKRLGLVAAQSLLILAPLLLEITAVTRDPLIATDVNLDSTQHQPDLIQFLLPTQFSRIFGPIFGEFMGPYTQSPIETAVFLTWIGILLAIISVKAKPARKWLIFTLICILFALGPNLVVMGRSMATDYELPIILPYAFLTSLPGFEFMRTPGRFMLVGYVGMGIVGGYGLHLLTKRFSKKVFLPIVLLAIFVLLIETWPNSWSQMQLRSVPHFYQELALQEGDYGVFDLPIRPYKDIDHTSSYISYSSYYQMYQMTHKKGIASGYIDRYYRYHPLFSHFLSNSTNDLPTYGDLLVNGEQTNRYTNMLFELASSGYKYLVFHKPQDWYDDYSPGSWGETISLKIINELFGDQKPLVDDSLVTVFEIPMSIPKKDLVRTVALRESQLVNWMEVWSGYRWAISPASLYVASPFEEQVNLVVTPAMIHDPQNDVLLDTGLLTIKFDDGSIVSSEITVGKPTIFPLDLSPGHQTITLILQLKDQATQETEGSYLNFAISTIDLQTH